MRDHSHHIDHIYRAAVEPEHWPVFLEGIRQELQIATIALFFRRPSDTEPSLDVALGVDERFVEPYRAHFHKSCPWIPGLAERSEGEFRAFESFVAEAELCETEFYNDWMRPQGILHGAGAFLQKCGPTELVSSIGGFREKGRKPFEREDLERIRPLVPHLQRALAIHRRLQEAELRTGAAEDVLDRIPGGVILLDERGAPVVTNRGADEILTRHDGLYLDPSGPRAAFERETRELQRLLAEAALTGAGKGEAAGATLRLTRPSGRPPLEVEVTPILHESLSLSDRRTSAAIFFADPDTCTECSPGRLSRVYGLTAMEAEVASRVARGLRLPEIADELGVTIHTVRDHLKHSFRKTGTHRQVDLVRVLLTGPGSRPTDRQGPAD